MWPAERARTPTHASQRGHHVALSPRDARCLWGCALPWQGEVAWCGFLQPSLSCGPALPGPAPSAAMCQQRHLRPPRAPGSSAGRWLSPVSPGDCRPLPPGSRVRQVGSVLASSGKGCQRPCCWQPGQTQGAGSSIPGTVPGCWQREPAAHPSARSCSPCSSASPLPTAGAGGWRRCTSAWHLAARPARRPPWFGAGNADSHELKGNIVCWGKA